MGSCFSASIGQKLQDYKWKTYINPYGTIYNPLSIFELIQAAMSSSSRVERIFEWKGIHYSWDTHSALSDPSKDQLLEQIGTVQAAVRECLKQQPWIVITPGTAWVYELLETGRLVANCHGYPQKHFRKRLLIPEEITAAFEQVHALVPDANWLMTVSPVRHIRDGLVENNQSKAVLIQAVHDIVGRYDNCFYFPSYEIVMDQLRDYRFYTEDLVHPNPLAIDYIWEHLGSCWLDEETQAFITEWQAVLRALRHKARHPGAESHQKFLHATILRLKRLGNKVDITNELTQLRAQLNE